MCFKQMWYRNIAWEQILSEQEYVFKKNVFVKFFFISLKRQNREKETRL